MGASFLNGFTRECINIGIFLVYSVSYFAVSFW